MGEPHLFDPGPVAAPEEQLSYDRRLTIRRREMLDNGVHPITHTALADNGETCGSCANHVVQGGTAGRYHKCRLNNTGGPLTDLRVSWPACTRWEAE
jgi:hypothetical protein